MPFSKDIDGVLGITFTNKLSGRCFAIITCYLPPETSTWGRDSNIVFAHILSLMYELNDVDAVFLTGDFNARIGDKSDISEVLDDVPSRTHIDNMVNQHGRSFIEFLHD